MNKIRSILLSVAAIAVLMLMGFPAWAEETKTRVEQSTFTLEVKDNLINLQAEQASFKEIFKDIEKKTGVKVNIFDDEGIYEYASS